MCMVCGWKASLGSCLFRVFNDFLKYDVFGEKKKIPVKLVCPYGIFCWHLQRKTCNSRNCLADIG